MADVESPVDLTAVASYARPAEAGHIVMFALHGIAILAIETSLSDAVFDVYGSYAGSGEARDLIRAAGDASILILGNEDKLDRLYDEDIEEAVAVLRPWKPLLKTIAISLAQPLPPATVLDWAEPCFDGARLALESTPVLFPDFDGIEALILQARMQADQPTLRPMIRRRLAEMEKSGARLWPKEIAARAAKHLGGGEFA
ncbi:hypothetical protein FHS21_002811 [Phyllobacterium trifolii]|uniref:Uncharacterized protein n=1 Tax=Phyllobacterium trifolii TaxID=300193 RepID=A0A839U5L0_9HYPH|nr:hypothetical protein [Phyllobacterium trifolii]MBB3146396.1 hypothetical protein [Phyllobacterium trifolii]